MKQKSFKFYTGIIIVYTFLLMYFTVALQMDGMNVLLPGLEAAYGWSRTEITGAYSMSSLLAVIAGFVSGTLILKNGVKKALIPTLIILGLDVIWMGMADTLMAFGISMIILQMLVTMTFLAIFALCSNWFLEKRGKVLGVVTIGAPLVSATFVPIGTAVVGNPSLGLSAFYTPVGLCVIALGLVGFKMIINKPEDVGLYVDGRSASEDEIQKSKEAMEERRESEWTAVKILKTKETWLLIFGFGFLHLIITGMMGQVISRLTDVGIPVATALLMLSVACLFGIPFSYFWGWLDDKLTTPIASKYFALVFVLASIAFVFVSPDNFLISFLACLCIANTTGGMMNLRPSIVAYVFGRKEFVNVNRYVDTGHNILRSASFIIMGYTFDKYGTYTPAFWIFAGLAVISFVCLSFVKVTYDTERIEMLDNK